MQIDLQMPLVIDAIYLGQDKKKKLSFKRMQCLVCQHAALAVHSDQTIQVKYHGRRVRQYVRPGMEVDLDKGHGGSSLDERSLSGWRQRMVSL